MSNKKIVSYDDYVNKVSWEDLRNEREIGIAERHFWLGEDFGEIMALEKIRQRILLSNMDYDEQLLEQLIQLGSLDFRSYKGEKFNGLD